MGITEDSVLIREALSGDEDAYAELVRRYQDSVARLALKITRRPDWVEDLCQEVFISAFKNLSRFKKRASFTTWLYRIAVNKSLEAVRGEGARARLIKRAARESLPDSLIVQDRMSGERLVLDRELQARVHDALGKLAPEMRAILTLRYLEELSTPEIARVLEIPEGTVRSRLHYSRIEMAKIMAPFMGTAVPARSKERE